MEQKIKDNDQLTIEQILTILDRMQVKLKEAINNTIPTTENENLIFNAKNHLNNLDVAVRAIKNVYDEEMTSLIVEVLEQVVRQEKTKEIKIDEGEEVKHLTIANPILLQGIYNLVIDILKEKKWSYLNAH